MQQIKHRNIAGKTRNRFADIHTTQLNIGITRCYSLSAFRFSLVYVESKNRCPKTPFTKIKREQTNSATDIQDRRIRATKQLISCDEDWVAAQLAPHITTQPQFPKLRCYANASGSLFIRISSVGGVSPDYL